MTLKALPISQGILSDGAVIAVKQLSSKSKQGNREFVNEIGMISALQHPNLVKLYGYCIKGNQLLLVYEYMENNSLARALFGKPEQKLNLDWRTRMKICVGIARGLTYLHEESRLKIVHRDIKATNVLLDKHLNAKISDFGLAKLDEEENTHISTRIAGTIGYMAPEYEMRGYLTDKADVYSFGVVALEIVSGMSNTNYRPKEEFVYLLDWAYVLQEQGNLLELVDPSLGSNYSAEEAMRMLQLALLCTNPSPTLRAPMSSVVSMLEGNTPIQAPIIKRSDSASGARFKAFELLSLCSGVSLRASTGGDYFSLGRISLFPNFFPFGLIRRFQVRNKDDPQDEQDDDLQDDDNLQYNQDDDDLQYDQDDDDLQYDQDDNDLQYDNFQDDDSHGPQHNEYDKDRH
ncbi:hypothetical protein KIW84_031932 [Lathyrus oleraceus]|uniref:Protein kinase domain-containing protein n=1 Tax=Pisum sativum TaxID=3888 RepID=A0A9D4XT41_PEA|nr:hypothetical protein KIW84_031932 [Pisum sativum]